MRRGLRNGFPPLVLSLLILAVVIPELVFAVAEDADIVGLSCRSCHDEAVFREGFQNSAHGLNTCVSCHGDADDMRRHITGGSKPRPVNCGSCHRDIASRFRKDVHYVKYNFQCQDCHQNIHTIEKSREDLKTAVVENCSSCHRREDYVSLGHGGALLRGNNDAATCTDCHGLHNTPYYDPALERDKTSARENYTRRCRSCHADAKMARRNEFSTWSANSYDETYHGKVFDMGYPQRVAGCADCHRGHNILPKDDPRSALHPDNLKAACQVCHEGFHKRFLSFDVHPDPLDAKRHPALYWLNALMLALLGGALTLIWLHCILWWRRAYSDKCRGGEGCFTDKARFGESGAEKHIQRFSARDRIMHILLIISFFSLAMTGLPLRYAHSPWAKMLIDCWGGAYRAGAFHRLAALVLGGIFLYACLLSLRFLFPDGRFRGWRQRLFAPDSLFPNRKDLRDILGMCKWFFGRGKMPAFDRWTYWEKIDFLVVLGAGTVIGGSGFILWFPEFFSFIMPGWMINVAAVVHSEAAFLTSIFVFTVHFFNNHLVPDKFPLERNIFTGCYPLEALRLERPGEYERLAAEGRLVAMKREGPGFWSQLFADLFGLTSLLLGLFLTALIFWSVLFH